MTTVTKRRPSYINVAAVASFNVTETIPSPRITESASKSKRPSLQSVTGSHEPEPQQYSDNVLWTHTMLSDSTSSSDFHDGLSNSVMITKKQMAIDQETHSSEPTDPAAMTANVMAADAMQQPPGFEEHMSYKIKTVKSSRKLEYFFGEQAPHDICIKEIRKEGLKAMLQSKTPLCYFLYHLLKEYSSENLFFFIEIEQYEAFKYTSPVQQCATAQHIHNTYLTRNSHFEVNLDDKVRRTVTDAFREKRVQGCFATAKQAVYSLLESSYMRFLQTDIFEMMVYNCGELTTHYSAVARNAAPQLLLQYLEQQHAMIYTNPHTDQTYVSSTYKQSSCQRHGLIRSMIQEFCRTMVGVHIEYSPSSSAPSHSTLKPFDFLFARRKHHHPH